MTAIEAQEYFARRNTYILGRVTAFERTVGRNRGVHINYNRIASGFFPKFAMQRAQYLLGNGVTLDEKHKKRLGPKFDITLQKMGMQCQPDGVNWGFWNYDHLIPFRATEFAPLHDIYTGNMRAGLRFWDVGDTAFIDVFAEDGIEKYQKIADGQLELIGAGPYKTRIWVPLKAGVLSSEIVDMENYPTIPIFPLYANELKQSEFTPGIKAMIDAYDAINSDLSDGITQIEGVYWVIEHFGGDDAKRLKEAIQEWKTIVGDDEQTATPHSIQIPYEAKQTALNLLRKQLYSDYMALDVEALTCGSLTNVAINVAKTDLDLKADIFEWQVADFVINILKLNGIEGVEPQFKRRTITNDTETVDNISTMLSDRYVDIEWAVKNSPLVADIDQQDLLDRLALAEQQRAEDMYDLEQRLNNAEETPGEE